MFTVKATYRNETRRFTFPKSVLFPTYKELHDQLYRVFPISHNYYLSRLIFSPDASKPGRILVGKEVHSAEDYDSCVAPLRRLWPNPLLRFAIFDETPHKVPSVALERLSIHSAPTVPLSETASHLPSPVAFRQACTSPPSLQPSVTSSHPHVHLFTPCVLPPPTSSKTATPPPSISLFPTSSKPCTSQVSTSVEVTPCCPVAKGKEDIEVLLSSFKNDLERILCRTFGTGDAGRQFASSVEESTSGVSGVDFVPPCTETSIDAGANTSRWCFVCKTSFAGVWYGCIKCPWHAVCPACFSKSHGAHTLSFGPAHVVQQRLTTCSTQVSAQFARESQPREIDRPQESVCSGSRSASTLAIHYGIICDNCHKTVVGVRHNCLDCPDYDLCTACTESGATERHNPFHEFCDIESPGCVYVPSALGGDRDSSLGNRCVPVSATTANPLVCHSANCDLCDSVIVGERYKCIVCPDFDTCLSCFSITMEQHPNHGFVKVSQPGDLMMRDSITLRQIIHPAVCDSCQKTIRGARFKCMHSNCPDFDLCASCEALPIPVHPLNHPLLKLKTSDAVIPTVIPTVYRVGEAQTIDELANGKSTICSESRSPELLSRSPPAIPMKLPELTPAVVPGQTSKLMMEGCAEEFLSPLGSPGSNVPGIVPTSATVAPPHLLVDVAEPESPRLVHAASDIYRDLWPRVSQEMMHLNAVQDLGVGDPVVNATITNSVAYKSSITSKSTLGTPISSISGMGEHHGTCLASSVLEANSIVEDYRPPSPLLPYDKESHRDAPQHRTNGQKETVVRQSWSLDSALVGDANVPDGQIFPPGAEFVKGWHMANNGTLPWPATTEIRFVDGEMFAPECSSALKAKVGIVHPGGNLDIWTGDLKAPDAPGRYVGYWRLNDGQGNFFGSRVWIDLTVVDHHSDQASEQSLAASSVVMPSARASNSVDASEELQNAPQPSLPSSETVTDEVEDPESDVTSVSLVSVPTSDGEDVEWQDTRTHSEPLEYVVLYDNHSEE